jgi:hypothetical protein
LDFCAHTLNRFSLNLDLNNSKGVRFTAVTGQADHFSELVWKTIEGSLAAGQRKKVNLPVPKVQLLLKEFYYLCYWYCIVLYIYSHSAGP